MSLVSARNDIAYTAAHARAVAMVTLIGRLVGVLPPWLRRRIGVRHVQLVAQMAQFGMVGLAGFVVDTAVVYAVKGSLGLYMAGAVAYAVAVTATWWLNRVWTFRGRGVTTPLHVQWLRFVAANIPGLVLNLGTYFALVACSTLCAAHPVLAVACGAVAGMTANFFLSRAVVFQ